MRLGLDAFTRSLYDSGLLNMTGHKHRKSKPKKTDHSQRMSRLKAKALAKVADQAWAGRQRYKTIALLSEAVRRDPKNPDLLISLASAYGKQRFYDQAEQLLTRLLDLAPRKASIFRRVGEAYAQIDRPQRAVECYRRSLELNRNAADTVRTLVELAGMYEHSHQLAEARGVLEEAIARDPSNGNVLLQQAILHRRLNETALAETILRDLIAGLDRNEQIRSNAVLRAGANARRQPALRRGLPGLSGSQAIAPATSPPVYPAQRCGASEKPGDH